MHRLPCALVWLVAVSIGLPTAAQVDFDPGGRGGVKAPRSPARPRPRPRRPKPPRGEKKPDVDKLIARYTAIALSRPDEPFPIQKLAELYRRRDGNLDALVREFEKRANAKGSDRYQAGLVLAGVYIQNGQRDEAAKRLEAAIAARPRAPAPRLMAARLATERGDHATAKRHYEAALPLVKPGVEKERTLRSLMLASIELDDLAAARRFHQRLVRAADNSLFVKRELGQELYNRGSYAAAEVEFRGVVTAAQGDRRALAPALRDLGKALAKQKKMDEALAVLKRARRMAGSAAGIRREILYLLTDVFRERGELRSLITLLEGEGGRDFQRLAIIGALYEETGQVEKALSTYRQALAINGRNIDLRVKLVHLLQTTGQLDAAIKEYEALIAAAPNNADFVFELADTLIQRGERDRALNLVQDLERRTTSDGDILGAVAEFYERIEEPKRALKVFERLAKLPQGDPQYLVDLGDRYFQAGERDKAMATWARIRTVISNRARASALLGETYLEHDMPDEALEAFREAVKAAPTRRRYRKQLAVALERTATATRVDRRRYTEALKIWQSLLDEAGEDALLARECRTHIVSLWAVTRQLNTRVEPLKRQFASVPPDLGAGRLLAEVQRRLRKHREAEATLRAIVRLAPGDESALLALERVLVLQRNLPAAIDVLERLVKVNPKRARQYYQRMAQYAAELYRDDDAIKYAAKAVELSPNDAQGHQKLGEMYRRRQNTERAMIEFRKAIEKNDRLFPAYFALAELLVRRDDMEAADRLYRRVVRTSRDEAHVVRAARQSMQINLGRGTLGSLERELLPVALGNPQKPVYRRLLVELYGAMTFPLVTAARQGAETSASDARRQLAAIGARAIKPLLDALSDAKVSQQRIAIEVLAYVQNRAAGPALFNYATGSGDRELRVRAMVACGALADPSLLGRYRSMLQPEGKGGSVAPGDTIALAAAWGVARMGTKAAEPLLVALMNEASSPEVRALGALGLGLSGFRQHAPALASLARSVEAGPTARAAAIYALGELGLDDEAPLLLALTDTPEPDLRRAAILALARSPLDSSTSEKFDRVLARAILSPDITLRRIAVAAAAAKVSGTYRRHEALPVPDGAVRGEEVISHLAPAGYSIDERVEGITALRSALASASRDAVTTSPERAVAVAALTGANLVPLVDTVNLSNLGTEALRALRDTNEAISRASVDGFAALAEHPSLAVRKHAVSFLARRSEATAQRALVRALDPQDETVCKAALSSINTDTAIDEVARLLRDASNWSLRRHAAEAMSRIGHAGSAKVKAEAALRQAAGGDPYALVREAALRSAAQRDPEFARTVLTQASGDDPEPKLQRLAKQLLSDLGKISPRP
ncbi:MAG: tetratricopeptide repeat protein [Myxococcota bacterium]